MNLAYRPYNQFAADLAPGGKITIDDAVVGHVAHYTTEKWGAMANGKPKGLGLFDNQADAIFAVIEAAITEDALETHFTAIDKFVTQFHTAEQQQQLAQIDEAIEAAKYGEYA